MTFLAFLLREVDSQRSNGREARFVATRNRRSEEVRRREASVAGDPPLCEMTDVGRHALRATNQ